MSTTRPPTRPPARPAGRASYSAGGTFNTGATLLLPSPPVASSHSLRTGHGRQPSRTPPGPLPDPSRTPPGPLPAPSRRHPLPPPDRQGPRLRRGVALPRHFLDTSSTLLVGRAFAEEWHANVVSPPPGSRYVSLTSDQQDRREAAERLPRGCRDAYEKQAGHRRDAARGTASPSPSRRSSTT